MSEPFISIVVPAYNAQRTIKKCIESLLGIDYPKYDILIVDDGSLDKTKNILLEYKDRIQIIESQHFGPSKCRNIAAQKAQGEFLTFTDADCIVDKNWLRELLNGFINSKVVAVGGSQCSPKDETFFGKCVQEFFELTGFLGGYIKQTKDQRPKTKDQNFKYLREVSHNPSCNVMYRKDVFLEIGGFDEILWPGEDVDIDYRLKQKGFIFMYNPKAIVYHYRPEYLKKFCLMMYRYGWVQGYLVKKYGIFRRLHLFVLFSIVSFIILLLFSIFLKFLLLFFIFVSIILFFLLMYLKFNLLIFIIGFTCFFYWCTGFLKKLILDRDY